MVLPLSRLLRISGDDMLRLRHRLFFFVLRGTPARSGEDEGEGEGEGEAMGEGGGCCARCSSSHDATMAARADTS